MRSIFRLLDAARFAEHHERDVTGVLEEANETRRVSRRRFLEAGAASAALAATGCRNPRPWVRSQRDKDAEVGGAPRREEGRFNVRDCSFCRFGRL